MKTVCYLLLASLLSTSLLGQANPSATPAPTLDVYEIIAKNAQAMGGWRQWESIQSIRQTGQLQRGEISVDYVVIRKRPDSMRMTLTLPPMHEGADQIQVIRACDGKAAWSATRKMGEIPTTPLPLDPQSTTDILADASFLPILMRLKQQDARFEKIGINSEKTNSPCYEVVARPINSELSYRLFISCEDFLVQHYEIQRSEEVIVSVEQKAFQQIEAIKVPTNTRLVEAHTGATSMQVLDTEIGVGIYDDYFLEPSKNKANVARN